MSTSARRRAVLLAGVGGAVFATTAPPTHLTAGVLVGLGLFAASLSSSTRARDAAARGLAFGFGANLVALRFVPEVVVRFTPLPFAAAALALVLLALGQAVPWGLGALVHDGLVRRLDAPRPLAFATGVYAATFVPAIFPWTPAGGLATWPVVLQGAELVGERGVSFLVAAVVGLVLEAALVRERRRGALVGAAVITSGVVAGGALRMRSVEQAREAAPRATVALLQPGFDASDRWDERRAFAMMDRLSALTRESEARGAALTVWPESAYPFTLARATRRAPMGTRAVLQPGVRGPVLTGAYMSAGGGLGTNAVFLATPDGAISEPYEKRHLLWFGETVPLADVFPWLRRVFARGTGLVPGERAIAFVTGPIRAAVLNCYEDTLPAAGREAMEVAPNLLVNVTNDAWFAGSAEGELHLRLAVLRAVETRRDLVRAVNRGPTSFVDAAGRVRARLDDGLPGPLLVSPALLEAPRTIYARFGDAPWLALLAGSIAWRTKRRGRRSSRTGARVVSLPGG